MVIKSRYYIKVFLKDTSGLTNICIQPEESYSFNIHRFSYSVVVQDIKLNVWSNRVKRKLSLGVLKKIFFVFQLYWKNKCTDRSLVCSETYRKPSKRSLLPTSFWPWFVDKSLSSLIRCLGACACSEAESIYDSNSFYGL